MVFIAASTDWKLKETKMGSKRDLSPRLWTRMINNLWSIHVTGKEYQYVWSLFSPVGAKDGSDWAISLLTAYNSASQRQSMVE